MSMQFRDDCDYALLVPTSMGVRLTPAQSQIAGYSPRALRGNNLGVIVDRDQFPAQWTRPTPYMQSVKQQVPAWAM